MVRTTFGAVVAALLIGVAVAACGSSGDGDGAGQAGASTATATGATVEVTGTDGLTFEPHRLSRRRAR